MQKFTRQHDSKNMASSRSGRSQVLDKISSDDFQTAFDLSNNEKVFIKSIDADGLIVGEINNHLRELKILQDGSIVINSLLSGKESTENISLVIHCLNLLALKKMTTKIKKIFSSAPAWFDKNFRISLQILNGEKINSQEQYQFSCVEDLHSYWSLIEIANFSKNKIPPELLAKHVLKIYRDESWAIQLAAMETLVNRIKSVQTEGLSVAKRPLNAEVTGFYKVRRTTGGVLGYNLLLTSNLELSISCDCKDYQKSTLRFCKHSASVFDYWFANEKRNKKFQRPMNNERTHIRWLSETGTRKIFDPLDGVNLLIPKKLKSSSYGIESFFNSDLKLKHNFKSVSDKVIALNQFKKNLEKCRLKIWIDPVIFPLLEREIEKLNWPSVFEKKKSQLFSVFKELNIKLYPYQVDGVKRALGNGKLLLGDDMGLGKTIQAITWAECLLRTKTVKKIIASLRPV